MNKTMDAEPTSSSYWSNRNAPDPIDGIFVDGEVADGIKTFDRLKTLRNSEAKRLGNHLEVAINVKVDT